MKKIISTLIILALTLSLTLSLVGCGNDAPTEDELSSLVSAALLSDNESTYAHGECSAEGHKVLGSKLSGTRLKVYALTMYGQYGFQNDMFIKVSGSGIIPAVLRFEKTGADYELLEIEYPRDGSEYVKSIKRMFPLKYRAAALTHSDAVYRYLSSQEQVYAEAYLKSIVREAVIGEYADLNTVLLTDLGVSVDVSNALIADKRLWQYPYHIGTIETLEDGTRYVHSLSLDESAGQIIYKTFEKESGTVIEKFVFDAVTGEELNATDA